MADKLNITLTATAVHLLFYDPVSLTIVHRVMNCRNQF